MQDENREKRHQKNDMQWPLLRYNWRLLENEWHTKL